MYFVLASHNPVNFYHRLPSPPSTPTPVIGCCEVSLEASGRHSQSPISGWCPDIPIEWHILCLKSLKLHRGNREAICNVVHSYNVLPPNWTLGCEILCSFLSLRATHMAANLARGQLRQSGKRCPLKRTWGIPARGAGETMPHWNTGSCVLLGSGPLGPWRTYNSPALFSSLWPSVVWISMSDFKMPSAD